MAADEIGVSSTALERVAQELGRLAGNLAEVQDVAGPVAAAAFADAEIRDRAVATFQHLDAVEQGLRALAEYVARLAAGGSDAAAAALPLGALAARLAGRRPEDGPAVQGVVELF